jgi:hypothetical protein
MRFACVKPVVSLKLRKVFRMAIAVCVSPFCDSYGMCDWGAIGFGLEIADF